MLAHRHCDRLLDSGTHSVEHLRVLAADGLVHRHTHSFVHYSGAVDVLEARYGA